MFDFAANKSFDVLVSVFGCCITSIKEDQMDEYFSLLQDLILTGKQAALPSIPEQPFQHKRLASSSMLLASDKPDLVVRNLDCVTVFAEIFNGEFTSFQRLDQLMTHYLYRIKKDSRLLG